ncbi:MAG TPA: serine/threonine-protein kinase [Candidatus Angelobacter sp.]
MDPKTLKQIDELVATVLGLPPEERKTFLRQQCADTEVRQRVESLITNHQEANGSDTPVNEIIQPGVTIGNEFTVVRELGKGSFGVVYLAGDRRGRPCALKTLLRHHLIDPDQLKMFRSEIFRWVQLGTHPNIVMAYGMEEFMRLPFVITEYIENASTLDDRLSDDPDWKTALFFGYHIANGLDYAYRKAGLIHNDLKPENVLVTPNGQAKVSDFGCSIAQSWEPGARAAGWTPAYSAPERWRREKPDTRTDIYSLGLILFQFATGMWPFPPNEYNHLFAPVPDPRAVRDDIPAQVADLIRSCLAKKRDERPGDMAVLAKTIGALYQQFTQQWPEAGSGPATVPDEIESLINMAKTYTNLGQLERALEAARKAVELDSSNLNAAIMLGDVYVARKNYEKAIEIFLRLHSRSPDDLLSTCNLVIAYHGCRNQSEAMAWFRKAYALAEKTGSLARLENITLVLAEQGKLAEALNLCNRILEENPRALLAMNTKSIALRRMGRLQEALATTIQALKLNPSYAKGWSNQASILAQLGRSAEAIESADRALEFDPTLTGPYAAKAAALSELGRQAEAVACLRQGIAACPDSSFLRKVLNTYPLR